MAQWVDFAEIRAKVSLEDVIFTFYGIDTLTRQGNKLVGPCPVHGGDSPRAFHADLDKNIWHCFSQCRKGGNQLDFVAFREGIPIREAALLLQNFFISRVHDNRRESKPAIKQQQTEQEEEPSSKKEPSANTPLKISLKLKKEHPHLIKVRQLQLSTIKHFGIGYCSRGIMRGCIAIPIHDDKGNLVAYSGRRLRPSDIKQYGKYKLPKGFRKELVLYNLHRVGELAQTQGLIVVEGFFSVMKLFEAGFTNVVALMGTEISEAQLELLAKSKEVILLLDGDQAGQSAGEAAYERLQDKVRTRLIKLPNGMEPEDLQPRALRWLINGATQLDLSMVDFWVHAPAQPSDKHQPESQPESEPEPKTSKEE